MAGRWWLFGGSMALALGCGQSGASGATGSAGPTGGVVSGGASGAGSAAMSDEAGAGGAGDAGEVEEANLTPAGYPRCGELYPARADDCEGIEFLTATSLRVSSNVDGSIEVGLFSGVDVWFENSGELEYDNVCVGAMVDTPGITLAGYEDNSRIPLLIDHVNPGAGFYLTVASLSVGSRAAGRTARFTVWTTFEGSNCLGPTATVDALVR